MTMKNLHRKGLVVVMGNLVALDYLKFGDRKRRYTSTFLGGLGKYESLGVPFKN